MESNLCFAVVDIVVAAVVVILLLLMFPPQECFLMFWCKKYVEKIELYYQEFKTLYRSYLLSIQKMFIKPGGLAFPGLLLLVFAFLH